MVDLGTIAGNTSNGSFSRAVAVNDAGQVVGESSYRDTSDVHAFSWT
jgi:probable HAF family extracellular repeat protein